MSIVYPDGYVSKLSFKNKDEVISYLLGEVAELRSEDLDIDFVIRYPNGDTLSV
jgi:hypothetical protein